MQLVPRLLLLFNKFECGAFVKFKKHLKFSLSECVRVSIKLFGATVADTKNTKATAKSLFNNV